MNEVIKSECPANNISCVKWIFGFPKCIKIEYEISSQTNKWTHLERSIYVRYDKQPLDYNSSASATKVV